MRFIPMKKIKNLKDLHSEKLRLKMELIAAEEVLKEDLVWVKEELKPAKIAERLFKKILGDNIGGLLNTGVRFTIDAVLKNLILSKSGWITRLLVPLIAKNLSSNYISENKPEIFGILRNLIHNARKSTNSNTSHYDKSTVDEMDY